jgi:hypothetical protein
VQRIRVSETQEGDIFPALVFGKQNKGPLQEQVLQALKFQLEKPGEENFAANLISLQI